MADRWARCVVVGALFLALTATAVAPSSAHGEREERGGPDAAAGNLSLAIDPSSWWMESGTNATFVAAWTEIPPACGLSESWFRWSVAPGGSAGSLADANGSAATLTASAPAGGAMTLVARAAGSLECDGNLTEVFGRAAADVTVAPPLVLGPVVVSPGAVGPNATVNLSSTLTGGQPPYRVQVTWGDGNVSVENRSGAGPFALPHRYGLDGSFTPVVLATDAAGLVAHSSPPEAVQVEPGFSAAIFASTFVTEVGAPVGFRVQVSDAPGNFSWLFECADAVPVGEGQGPGISFGCAFQQPGAAPVLFDAVGARGPFATATATLLETVDADVSLGYPAPAPPAEVGVVVYAPILVTGGVPPYTLSWALVGAGTSGTMTVGAGGLAFLPVSSGVAGSLPLTVGVVDALGMEAVAPEIELEVSPALALWAAAGASLGNGSVNVYVSGDATGGALPIDWSVEPGSAAGNASPPAGELATAGSFAWNATFRVEGDLSVTVVAVDALGAAQVVNLTVALAPPLAVAAQVFASGAASVTLRCAISGGVPPYTYRWNDSAGESWNGTIAAPGTVVLTEATEAAGSVTFRVEVVDALDAIGWGSANLTLDGASPDGAGESLSLVVSAGLVLVATVALAGTGYVVARRRRLVLPSLPPPDPVEVLRETISASDGVDRGLVELLAEERGVPAEVVAVTLERLKAEGRVRYERGADGEEVLAWSDLSSP